MHSSSVLEPQAVEIGSKPLSVQAPELSQVSGTRHELLASPHTVPATSLFASQVPAPSHVSGSVQAPFVASPHVVPAASSFVSQEPAPSQVSGAVQLLLLLSPQAVPATRGAASQLSVVSLQVPLLHSSAAPEQSVGEPPEQAPPEQVSPVLQKAPSSQAPPSL